MISAEITSQRSATRDDYRKSLGDFDAAVCEAMAVGQATSQRFVLPTVGYSTYVFTRICANAQLAICAAPESRWVKRDSNIWDVSSIAGYVRAILEGYILFIYLVDAPTDLAVQQVYLDTIHLYDCKKRTSILPSVLDESSIKWFGSQEAEIIGRLQKNQYFSGLDPAIRKSILRGERIHIPSRADLVEAAGIEKEVFDFFYNYLSQYTHILSFSFHRIEENGRGAGIENDFDRGALVMVLRFAANVLRCATDKMIILFPDAKGVRLGVSSKFSPGPIRNLPRNIKKERGAKRWL